MQKLHEDTLHGLYGDGSKHVGVIAELCNKIINHCHSIMNRYIVEDNHLTELDGFIGKMEDDYHEQEQMEQEREQ
ncbi:unnamed protein product [Rotaria sp. Silwood1]|nr:unnamed protein product [Rotaria sp. Silwood1]